MEQYVTEIWIWGVKFTSIPGTMSQAEAAQKIVQNEYPGMNVVIKEVVAK